MAQAGLELAIKSRLTLSLPRHPKLLCLQAYTTSSSHLRVLTCAQVQVPVKKVVDVRGEILAGDS